MGKKPDWFTLKQRLAGKWQVPMLVAALVLFAATIHRTRPEPRVQLLKPWLAELDAAIDGKQYNHAVREARNRLAQSGLSSAERAQIELRLGRARFGALQIGSKPTIQVARQIEKHFQAASPGLESPPLAAADFVTLGRLSEWQALPGQAVDHLHRAILAGHPGADDLRKNIFLLHRDELQAGPDELREQLDKLLSEVAPHRHDLRIWAVEERIALAERLGNLEEAEDFLARQAAQFEESDFSAQFEFLRCRLLAAMGRDVEATLGLRALRNQVEPSSPVSAKAGSLLGQVLLRSADAEKWNEALSFFSDVVHHADGSAQAAARVGQGEALAKLGRHDEAIASFGLAARYLDQKEFGELAGLGAVRSSLAITAETLRQQGDLGHALHYADMAVRFAPHARPAEKAILVYPRALLKTQLADQLMSRTTLTPEVTNTHGKPDEAAQLYISAAGDFKALADWNVHNEPRNSDFSWKSADLLAKGGADKEAIFQFREFVDRRPEDHRCPAALVRMGEIHFGRGELSSAARAFQECHLRFPRSFEGARALVPLARTYLAMGQERLADAEAALRLVLDDSEMFTPQAGEFVEAQFLLGEVLERGEQLEAAIGALQEALDRYPNDPQAQRARFLLGGVYRRSAWAVRDKAREAQSADMIEQIRGESARRFLAARQLYRQVIDDLEFRQMGEPGAERSVYLRYAYLYEADCCFETQNYRDALRLYEQAAANLGDSARGLSAHVQLIHCHVFLGEPREARAALSRAQVTVDAMPDGAFANRIVPESRQEWKQYFEWLSESELF